MARRKKKRKNRKEPAQQQAKAKAVLNTSTDFGDLETGIRVLLQNGKTREAVRQAKEAHKHFGTEQSENLLGDAYAARIREMFQMGMTQEGDALLAVAAERYPGHAQTWQSIRCEQDLRSGNYNELVRPLSDPDVSPSRREEIDNEIRRNAFDLDSLSNAATLPEDHSLRVSAAAVLKAFTAATSGPVEDADIALPEVSRRSPLAPWKMLIRAIANFYRGEDEECERCLEAVDPVSAPARLVPVIANMLHDQSQDGAAGKLHDAVKGSRDLLYAAFNKLDEAFNRESMRRAEQAGRAAEKRCSSDRPDLLQDFAKRFVTRGVMLGYSPESIQEILTNAPAQDAEFFRLLARGAEVTEDEPHAVEHWDQFRRAALEENLIESDSPEESAIYLHMANILRGVPDFYLDIARERNIRADGECPYFLDPDQLYMRACAADPQPESFSQWLDAVKGRGWQATDKVALAWHDEFPNDSRPLLFLMQSCEKRKALKKALKYLEQAEAVEAMNPDVRRARLRIWFSTAERHLKQEKPHLARKDFEAMEQLPQLEGDRVVYLRALQMTCSLIEKDLPEANRISAELSEQFGSAFCHVLREHINDACGVDCLNVDQFAPPICGQVARALMLLQDLDKQFRVPHLLERIVLNELMEKECSLDSASLYLIGKTVAEWSFAYDRQVAFHASRHGLRRKDELQAGFMLLRARSMRYRDDARAADCAAAAAVMARRRRDAVMASEAIDLLDYLYCDADEAMKAVEEVLTTILANEISAEEPQSIVPQIEYDAPTPPEDLPVETDPSEVYEPVPRKRARPIPHQPLLPIFDEDSFYAEDEVQEAAPGQASQEEDPEDEYLDDDDDDYWPDDELELEDLEAIAGLEDVFKDFHPAVKKVFLEMLLKHGSDAHPDLLRKTDPDLFYRLESVLSKHGMPDPDHGPAKVGSRKSSNRKRKKRKSGKRR